MVSNSRGVRPAAWNAPNNGSEISPLDDTRTKRFSSGASNTEIATRSFAPMRYSGTPVSPGTPGTSDPPATFAPPNCLRRWSSSGVVLPGPIGVDEPSPGAWPGRASAGALAATIRNPNAHASTRHRPMNLLFNSPHVCLSISQRITPPVVRDPPRAHTLPHSHASILRAFLLSLAKFASRSGSRVQKWNSFGPISGCLLQMACQ